MVPVRKEGQRLCCSVPERVRVRSQKVSRGRVIRIRARCLSNAGGLSHEVPSLNARRKHVGQDMPGCPNHVPWKYHSPMYLSSLLPEGFGQVEGGKPVYCVVAHHVVPFVTESETWEG